MQLLHTNIRKHKWDVSQQQFVLVRGSARVDRGLAAHVMPCHLNLEQCPICTHAELEAQPIAVIELLPMRRTWQSWRADHHCSVQDDAIFLLKREKKSCRITASNVNKADCFWEGQAGLMDK